MALDHHTKEGAERLAGHVRDYWERKGKKVDVWTEEEGFVPQMRSGYWVIRSDLVNGRPKGDRNKILSTSSRKPNEISNTINVVRMRLHRDKDEISRNIS